MRRAPAVREKSTSTATAGFDEARHSFDTAVSRRGGGSEPSCNPSRRPPICSSFFERTFQYICSASAVFSAVFRRFSALDAKLDRPVFLVLFFALRGANPLESLERRPSGVRKSNPARKFSSLPAERERRSTAGAASPGGISGQHGPAEAEGRTGRSPAVKPRRRNGWRTGWRIGWPIGGGGPESGKVPARFFVRFFRGRRLAAAGALRALTGPI